MSLLDFWLCFAGWWVGAIVIWLIVKMWIINMRKYPDDTVANGLFSLVSLVVLVVLIPPMFMGFWHFINMVLQLSFGWDLYFLVS